MLSDMINAGSFVKIGGDLRVARELSLRDLAELEAWARSCCPSGFDALYYDPEAPDRMDRLRELRARIRLADHLEYLAHPFGLAKLAARSLRLPEGTDAVILLGAATEPQIKHLVKVAYGTDPVALLEDLMWPEDAEPPGRPTDRDQWTRIIDHVCREYGWTIPEVLDLTPTQVGYLLRKGKSARAEKTASSGPDDIRAHFNKHYRRIYGEDMPSGDPNQVEHRRGDEAGEG